MVVRVSYIIAVRPILINLSMLIYLVGSSIIILQIRETQKVKHIIATTYQLNENVDIKFKELILHFAGFSKAICRK